MSKSPEEAIVIIDSIAASDYQSHHDRAPTLRKGIMELDTQSAILAQNKLLTQQIEVLTKQISQLPQQYHQSRPQKTHQAHQVQQILRCDFCSGNHQNVHCLAPGDGQHEKEAYYLQNQAIPQQNFQGSYQGYRGGVTTCPSAGARCETRWCVFQGRKMHGVATNVYSRKMSEKSKWKRLKVCVF